MTVWLGSWAGATLLFPLQTTPLRILWPHGRVLLIPSHAHALHADLIARAHAFTACACVGPIASSVVAPRAAMLLLRHFTPRVW
ncbi:hypothetical protein OAO87_02665 [bacterium]|nr:hypothetical protein [bacterium]